MNKQTAQRSQSSDVKKLLIRNTMYASAAQALSIPLSILSNAIMARYLAADAFGQIYIASTLTGLGLLFVNLGSEGSLPAAVARDRSNAGLLLGSSLTFRLGLLPIVYAAAVTVGYGLAYGPQVQWAMAVMFLGNILVTTITAGKETLQGFERSDILAGVHFGQQLVVLIATVLARVCDAGFHGMLLAQALSTILLIPPLWWWLRSVGVVRVSVRWETARDLIRVGFPFVIMGLVGYLQPNVDAAYLARLTPPDVVGSYSVARRLLGVLMLPAAALVGVLYPTLCRLWSEDRENFLRVSGNALRGVYLLAAPLALACGVYPEVGVSIFGREHFRLAEDDLQVLSIFVLLVYMSMPLSTCILAAGKQRAWSMLQALCVVVSLSADWFLVRWAQSHTGNGALGVCIATVVGEAIVVGVGLYMLPKGILDRRFARLLLLSFVAGAVMTGVAMLLNHRLQAWFAAPISFSVYFGVLYLIGGIEPQYIAAVRGFAARKLARLRAAS